MRLPESKKLTGLLITLAALLVLLIIAIIAVGVFGIGESLFAQIGGFITSLGTAHQGAQMMADRSPNYPNPPALSSQLPIGAPSANVEGPPSATIPGPKS